MPTSQPSFPKKILVTGATGMLGTYFLMQILEKGLKARAVFRNSLAKSRSLHLFRLCGKEDLWKQIRWVKADVTDIYSLSDAMDGVDTVIHAAAKVSFAGNAREELLRVNYRGTANMVDAALDAGISYFLHVSSIAALGGSGSIDEKVIWTSSGGHSYYGISKHLAEMEVWRGMQEGLPAGIINPSVIIGPSASAGEWQTGFGKTLTELERGKLPFVTPGITGYVDVRDVARIGMRMIREKITGERFIVSAENRSFAEILQILAREMGRKPPRRVIPRRILLGAAGAVNLFAQLTGRGKKYDPEALKALYARDFFDTSKLQNRFRYTFVPVDESLKYTVALYRKHRQILSAEKRRM